MPLVSKGSKIYGMIYWKCPKCHEGDLFSSKLTDVTRSFAMHPKCPNCGQSFLLEPGFYWGAMYIDYILASMIMLASFALGYFLMDLTVLPAFGLALLVASLMYVIIYRTGRAIWINAFVKFNPPASPE